MPNWLRSFTEILRFWQTWFFTVTVTIPTVWAFVSTNAAGLPAHQIILYSGGAFALFSGGAMFCILIASWLEHTIGPRRLVYKSMEMLNELSKREHKHIFLRDLAEHWAGTVGSIPHHGTWVRWNSRFRDLKDATNRGLLSSEMTAVRPQGRANMKTRVTIESALKFFESDEWKQYS